jgi:hypothetical protein
VGGILPYILGSTVVVEGHANIYGTDGVKGKAGKALGTLYKIFGKHEFVKYGLRKDSF